MLPRLLSLFEENLFESVLPFWLRHSIDPLHGGYFTCLECDGALYDSRKYVWLNGRQLWTLSRLFNSVEQRPEWLAAARSGAEFLKAHVFDPNGRCYFSLTREGVPAFFQRKPYGAGFVALGFLEYSKASGDPWYRHRAEQLFTQLHAWIDDPTLLGRPALPGGIASSNLADIYILASVALELGHLPTLRACLQKIRLHFDPTTGLLHETATLDPALRCSTPDARLICAGSIFEVYWILSRALQLCPDPELETLLLRSIDAAFDFSWDPRHGGFHYFQDIAGRPTLQLESSMKLWWVHCEAIYALLTAYLNTRDDRWLSRLDQVHHWTWQRFPDPEYGEWFGYLQADGTRSHSLKGNHYKGCFHVPRMLLYSIQDIRRSTSR